MTQAEFRVWAKAFSECYPASPQMKTDQSLTIWYECLKDIPYNIAASALAAVFKSDRYEPKTPAPIRDMAVSMMDNIEDWSSGWQSVCDNIHRYGACIYDADRLIECMESFDDVTRETVKRIGWTDICMSENKNILRAQFRDIYESIKARKQTKQLIGTQQAQIEG